MSGVKSSANIYIQAIALLLLVSFVFQFRVSQAEIYMVGDDKGWTYGSISWTEGKTFKVGDTLMFYYDPPRHTVVKIPSSAYPNCMNLDEYKPVYTSGTDEIILESGMSYFSSSVLGDCAGGGMKIIVKAI